MAEALQTALNNHERAKRSTDIPLFYGSKDKDTVTAQQLVDRIERAAGIANWDAPTGNPQGDAAIALAENAGRIRGARRRCDELYLCLRGKGISWYQTLDNIPGFTGTNWDVLKQEFIDAYAPRYTARTLCVTLQELRQKKDEDVQDFYNRVSDAFRNAYQTKPDDLKNFTGTDGERGGATAPEANVINLMGVNKMQLQVMNTIFLGGLQDDLRSKVLENKAEITTIQDSVKYARSLEVLICEKKPRGTVIATVEEDNEEGNETPQLKKDDASKANIMDQVLHAVNTIFSGDNSQDIDAIGAGDLRHKLNQNRQNRNSQRSGGGNRGRNRGGGGGGRPRYDQGSPGGLVLCWYCNIPGHIQTECQRRKREGGAFRTPQHQGTNQGGNFTVHSVTKVLTPGVIDSTVLPSQEPLKLLQNHLN